ncbi:MAG: NAD(P)-dependent oxidoreductase, partial [Litorilinea sp.]
ADQYTLRALNRSAVEGVETHQASITDFDAIRPAFDGVDTVVHLAAVADVYAPWEDLLNVNIIGTRNVFQAAIDAGVKRVVFASSGSTIASVEQDEPYKAIAEGRYAELPQSWPLMDKHSEPRPWGVYGATKLWGEALARHFVDTTDISILCLRIGVVNAEDRPTQTRQYANWCSQRDIATMIGLAIDAPPELRFDIFYVISNNRYGYRDLSHAHDVLGYVPQDSADKWL